MKSQGCSHLAALTGDVSPQVFQLYIPVCVSGADGRGVCLGGLNQPLPAFMWRPGRGQSPPRHPFFIQFLRLRAAARRAFVAGGNL